MKRILLTLGMFLWLLGTSDSLARAGELEDYQQAVDVYRSGYNQYQIKKSSYLQAQTFLAEEEFVQSAQKMLLSRANVWMMYWKLELSTISSLPQLSDSKKNEWAQQLKDTLDWLEAHKHQIESAKTKSLLLQEAVDLNTRSDSFNKLAYMVNEVILINKIQEAMNQLQAFNASLADRIPHQEMVAEVKDARLRGLAVNAERLHALSTKISLLEATLQQTGQSASATSFANIPELVNPVYAEMSQLKQVLSELSEGVAW